MEKLQKRISVLFTFSLLASIGFPLGVLGIIFGAANKITALLVIGIIFTVVGFYGTPILWLQYAERRCDRTVLLMIERESIRTVPEIAEHTGYNESNIRERIKKLIVGGFLSGYQFSDDAILSREDLLKQNQPPAKKKCDCCGADMYFRDGAYRCDYCLSIEEI